MLVGLCDLASKDSHDNASCLGLQIRPLIWHSTSFQSTKLSTTAMDELKQTIGVTDGVQTKSEKERAIEIGLQLIAGGGIAADFKTLMSAMEEAATHHPRIRKFLSRKGSTNLCEAVLEYLEYSDPEFSVQFNAFWGGKTLSKKSDWPNFCANYLRSKQTLNGPKKEQDKCKVCGDSTQMLFKCSRCHSVLYCSKACQVKDWKSGHKPLCAQLAQDSKKKGPPMLPYIGIAILDVINGCSSQEIFLKIAPWKHEAIQDHYSKKKVSKHAQTKRFVKGSKKFFKRLHDGGVSAISSEDVGFLSLAVVCLHILGYPGVRYHLPFEAEIEASNYKHVFIDEGPIPKDWKLSPHLVKGFPEEKVSLFEGEIKKLRAQETLEEVGSKK